MKYLPLFILTLFFWGCNDSYDIPKNNEELDRTFYRSDITPLSESQLEELLKDATLDTSVGEHGNLYKNNMDTVTLSLEGVTSKGVSPKRYFSYYIPSTLSDNYKIFFEFHGNFSATPFSNMIGSTYISDTYKQFAEDNNTIVVQPIGSISPLGSFGWNISENDLYYFDALLGLIKKEVKNNNSFEANPNSVYVTGTSSGGIFSWGLSYYRSEVVGVAVPRFGSVRMSGLYKFNQPATKVPMMIVTGKRDTNTANFEAVLNNADSWAKNIYEINSEAARDTIENFDWGTKGKAHTPVTTTVYTQEYRKGNNFIKTFLIQDASHSEIKGGVYPEMFKFMINNTRK